MINGKAIAKAIMTEKLIEALKIIGIGMGIGLILTLIGFSFRIGKLQAEIKILRIQKEVAEEQRIQNSVDLRIMKEKMEELEGKVEIVIPGTNDFASQRCDPGRISQVQEGICRRSAKLSICLSAETCNYQNEYVSYEV